MGKVTEPIGCLDLLLLIKPFLNTTTATPPLISEATLTLSFHMNVSIMGHVPTSRFLRDSLECNHSCLMQGNVASKHSYVSYTRVSERNTRTNKSNSSPILFLKRDPKTICSHTEGNQ